VYTDFYLHQDGTLAPESPSEGSSCSQYLFDPGKPVPTVGGNFSSLDYLTPPPPNVKPPLVPGVLRRAHITPQGGFDQREGPQFFGSRPPYMPLASRSDVLVFQTPPMEEDVEVTGPLQVKLWVSSSAGDTDFTAKLIDVYPPTGDYPEGYALNISDSILRMRYRESWSNPVPMEPGRVYPITMTLYPTSNVFKRGHRMRLDISSSNFPRFDVNPNTGEPLGKGRRVVVAENTLFHDRDHPSHITLPIILA
jgi:hypothetical protein